MSSSSAGARSAISPDPDKNRAASAVVASAAIDRAGVVQRLQLRQALGARGRLRQPLDGGDDVIEFEGLEGSGVHGVGARSRELERNPQSIPR